MAKETLTVEDFPPLRGNAVRNGAMAGRRPSEPSRPQKPAISG
jgi:hypothetical protein